MKYLLLILLFPSLLQAQSKAISEDKTVEVTTSNPNIILEYIGYSEDEYLQLVAGKLGVPLMSSGKRYTDSITSVPRSKFDTIGAWHLVSDTSKGWNPVSAMYLYEVRLYKSYEAVDFSSQRGIHSIPTHYKWLDSNKKPIYLKVWQAN